MNKISKQIIDCFNRGGKVIIFGNGGSLADASHFAAEFNGVGSVIALDNAAKLTAIGNDFGFLRIFSMQLEDVAVKGDLVIGLSSSGKSANVLIALTRAGELGVEVVDFPRSGKDVQQIQNYQYRLLHDIYLEVRASL